MRGAGGGGRAQRAKGRGRRLLGLRELCVCVRSMGAVGPMLPRGYSARTCRGDRAQATVEMAVVLPVLLILALIVYNVMLFTSAAARFDRVAPDIVVVQAVSPSGEVSDGAGIADASGAVAEALEAAMDGYEVEIEVTCASSGSGEASSILSLVGELRIYRCTMRYVPWPSGISIAGVRLGAPAVLSHTREVTIDPWRPGVVM